jgi:hypothetical protein
LSQNASFGCSFQLITDLHEYTRSNLRRTRVYDFNSAKHRTQSAFCCALYTFSLTKANRDGIVPHAPMPTSDLTKPEKIKTCSSHTAIRCSQLIVYIHFACVIFYRTDILGRTELMYYYLLSSCLCDTLYQQKFALTSPTSGGRSVGIVRLRTKSHGVLFCL